MLLDSNNFTVNGLLRLAYLHTYINEVANHVT